MIRTLTRIISNRHASPCWVRLPKSMFLLSLLILLFIPITVIANVGSIEAEGIKSPTLMGPFYTNDPEGLVILPDPVSPHPVAYNLSIGWVNHGRYIHGYRGVARYQWHLDAMCWGRTWGISRMYWFTDHHNMLHLSWQRIKGTFTAVASLTAQKPTKVVLESYPAWPGYGAKYRILHGRISGRPRAGGASAPEFILRANEHADETITASTAGSFTKSVLGGGTDSKSGRYAGLVFNVVPGHPLTFLAALRPVKTGVLSMARRVIRSGWKTYAAHRPRASGDWGNFISPISSAANESVVYVPSLRNLSATVVRGWCLPDRCVIFEWDSFFNSVLLSINSRDISSWLSRRQLAGTFHFQAPNGLICNFSNWLGRKRPDSDDRSEPPVAAMCVWQDYQRWPNKKLLRECYKPLVRYHHWWFAINPETHLPYRDGNRDGLLEWGSDDNHVSYRIHWQYARYESGMDDTPMYLPSKVRMMASSDTYDVDDVGLNSLWAADAMYLAKIATVLGHHQAAAHYTAQWKSMGVRINALLWNHKLGMYCNRYWSRGNGHHLLSRIWSPTNFYPMIAKIPDANRARRMLAVMLNKKYFWGRWVIPTISQNTPYYKHQEYWRGDIWGPTNYLVFQGLLHDAPASVIHAYARRSVRLFMRNWDRTGVWSENYLATTGIASHDRHYSWGALLPAIGLEAICNIGVNNKVRLDGTWKLHAKLSNIPILGYRYTVVVTPGRTELLRHGKVVATADGKIISVRLPIHQIN